MLYRFSGFKEGLLADVAKSLLFLMHHALF